jgi:hypothetical protein
MLNLCYKIKSCLNIKGLASETLDGQAFTPPHKNLLLKEFHKHSLKQNFFNSFQNCICKRTKTLIINKTARQKPCGFFILFFNNLISIIYPFSKQNIFLNSIHYGFAGKGSDTSLVDISAFIPCKEKIY